MEIDRRSEVPGSSLLGRRIRALTHLAPIFHVHQNRDRNPSDVDFERYDFLALTLVCVDAVALGSGMSGDEGVERDQVLDEITTTAAQMAPDRPRNEHSHVARFLLDKLLRHGEPTTHFEVDYASPDDSWKVRTERVRLLYETTSYDGQHVLVNADPAAVNLLLVATDLDIADAQVAQHAVLNAQVRSGRLPQAIDKANEGVKLSRMYAAAVRRMVADAQRDVTQVSFDDHLAPELDRSETHLDDRLQADSALLMHVAGALSASDDPKEVADYREIQRLLRESHTVLARLHSELITAAGQWRNAQSRQAFVPTWAGSVEPAQACLDPLLTEGSPAAADTTTPVFSRRLLPFTAVVDRLTRPPQRPQDTDGRHAEIGDLEDVIVAWEQFPDLYHDIAEVLRQRRVPAGGKAHLSDLFNDAHDLMSTGGSIVDDLVAATGSDEEDVSTRLQLLLALDALLMWRPDGIPAAADVWWSTTSDHKIAGPLRVPDLLIHRHGGLS